MKLAVIGANGKAGQLIVKEALAKGVDVTAIVRQVNKSEADKVLTKDLFDLTYSDLKDFDVIVDAFGVWAPEQLHLHSSSLKHLADILSGHKNRLLVVGGAGSLYLDKEHKNRLMDQSDFPDLFKPLAENMGAALDELKKRNDFNWTYISPAADFQADGRRTGSYTLGGEEFKTTADGKSYISYADYALAVIDEALSGSHYQQRISVISE
ncbi:NAD(P)-dependent oxidoreductase [Enterococcus sp. LJL51]|uniref:NAD(P)-dependent oxidoreductase n=1 Tax=Enterococcus sp. LJL51 TaxID=3416656 RepID=UPI003CF54B7D